MRTVSILTVALAFAACDQSGADRLPVDFGTDADTSEIDGTEVDTDTDDPDTDTEEDTGISGIGSDCHAADPVDQTGWTRTYATNYEGTVGTEVQSPGGLGTGPTGEQAYIVNSVITPSGSEPISIQSYRSCTLGQLGWEGENVTGMIVGSIFGVIDVPVDIDVEKSHNGDAPLLPPFEQMNAGTLINYGYTQMDINLAAQSQQGTAGIGDIFSGGTPPNCKSDPALPENDATCIDISGEMTVDGPFNRTVGGTTWSAYMVTDIRSEVPAVDPNAPADPGIQAILDLLGIGNVFGSLLGFGGGTEREILSVTFYVEGIGIVEQQVYDYTSIQNQSPENLIVTRELTGFTGL